MVSNLLPVEMMRLWNLSESGQDEVMLERSSIDSPSDEGALCGDKPSPAQVSSDAP